MKDDAKQRGRAFEEWMRRLPAGRVEDQGPLRTRDDGTPYGKAIERWLRQWEKVRDDVAALTCPDYPEDYDRMAMLIRAVGHNAEAGRLWAEEVMPDIDERVDNLRLGFEVFYAHSLGGADPETWQRDSCFICRFVDGGYREFFDWHTRAGTRGPDAPLPEGDPPDGPQPFVKRLDASMGHLRFIRSKTRKLVEERLLAMTPEEHEGMEARIEEGEEDAKEWSDSYHRGR